MRRAVVLIALVWIPFVSIFAFAHPALTGAVGDSYPHMAFHVLGPALLIVALVVTVRRWRESTGAPVLRVVLGVLALALTLAVVGNAVELLAAVQRFAADGFVSRLTPDLFGPDGGLHAVGATVTIPAHMASMVLTLAVLGLEAARSRRAPVRPPARAREAAARR